MPDTTPLTTFLAAAAPTPSSRTGARWTRRPASRCTGFTIWEDGDPAAGIWECTPGPSRWMLETTRSSTSSRPDDVHPRRRRAPEIGPGDLAVFPQGWSGTWDIHETIRKVYVLF